MVIYRHRKGTERKQSSYRKERKKMKTNLLTLETARQFIEDNNLEEEFTEWAAEANETDLDYLTLDFAAACDEFEDWAKENLETETENDEEADYWDSKTTEMIEKRLFGEN